MRAHECAHTRAAQSQSGGVASLCSGARHAPEIWAGAHHPLLTRASCCWARETQSARHDHDGAGVAAAQASGGTYDVAPAHARHTYTIVYYAHLRLLMTRNPGQGAARTLRCMSLADRAGPGSVPTNMGQGPLGDKKNMGQRDTLG